MSRRSFLHDMTAAVGAAGIVAAAWPFIDQMNPDAGTLAAQDIVELDLIGLRPAKQFLVHWRNIPVSVVRRTADMLDAMRERSFVGRLVDPDSQTRQQPTYAKNWHRSIDPAYAVLAGVCTYCGCVPSYLADAFPPDLPGGYLCPCCASHYDPAGRAYSGVARYNLAIPPYTIVRQSRILIGRNMSGEIFSFESVERI